MFRAISMAAAWALVIPAAHADLAQTVQFNIEPQALQEALIKYSSQSQVQVTGAAELISGKQSVGVVGTRGARNALEELLRGTDLTYDVINENTVIIRRIGDKRAASGDGTGLHLARADVASVAPSEQQSGSGDALEEIVVTAQKRAERLQDTAMSLSVLSSKDIEQKGLSSMQDYLRATPGVSYLDQGVGRNAIVIRGITTAPQSEGITNGQTVGVYFGEVPISGLRWSPADIRLVDMERIEVLRGPQGTLYGSGSLSGAVRNIPAAPNLREVAGSITAGLADTAGNGGLGNEQSAVVNYPLIEDKLAVRVVGYRFDDSGYVKNIAGSDPALAAGAASWGAAALARNEDEIGQVDTTGGRIAALWKPFDELSATFTYLVQNAKQDGLPEVELGRGAYQQERLQISNILGGGNERLGDRSNIANLVIDYELPWAALTSSSSYSEQTFQRYYGIGVFYERGPGFPIPQFYETKSDGFSQELRLVSRFEGRVQFVAGLYYEDLELHEFIQQFFGGDPALNPFPALEPYNALNDTHLRQKAVFGEVSYDLTRQLKVTLGARAFDYDRSLASVTGGAFGGGSTAADSGESDSSYKANISYKPSENALLYAQWAQGFRVGRPLTPFPFTCDANGDGFVDGYEGRVPRVGGSLLSDSLDSYELGGKLSSADNRWVVNGSVYQVDWVDLPVGVPGPVDCSQAIFLNAGKARSQGVEIETSFYVSRALRINLGASLTKIELDGDASGIGLDGDRLPGSPEKQFSAGLQYGFQLAQAPAYVRADYAYIGSYFNQAGEHGSSNGAYGQVNARFGMSLKAIDLALFANNLTNSDGLIWADPVFPDGRALRLRPRTVGVNATMRF